MKHIFVTLLLAAGVWACFASRPEGPRSEAIVGELAPEVRLRWVDGTGEGALSDLRGRVVLLEFWRTGCDACLDEVAHLNDLHERYADEGLSIVALSQEEAAAVRSVQASAAITYPLALDEGGEAERTFGITAVPRAFLVDRDGALVWVGHPGTLEEGRLRELLSGR